MLPKGQQLLVHIVGKLLQEKHFRKKLNAIRLSLDLLPLAGAEGATRSVIEVGALTASVQSSPSNPRAPSHVCTIEAIKVPS